MSIHARILVLAAGMSLLGASPAEAQLAGKLKDAVKQGMEDRKQATEDGLVMRSALLGDSIAALGLAPVGGLADDVASGAESAVTGAVAALSSSSDDPVELLRAGLDAGRVELADVFLEATAEPTPEGEELLGVLAGLLVERGEPILLEAYASYTAPPDLAERRVRIARTLLMAYGADPGMLFGSTDGIPFDDPAEDGSSGAADLRARPLR